VDLQRYFLVLLWRTEHPPALSEDELAVLQRRHLAFYEDLREQGIVALNGPLRGQPDERLRGLAVFCTESGATALAHGEQDPMVEAGWLRVEAAEFWTQPGAITASGIPFSI
jgi:uncharacterized protein